MGLNALAPLPPALHHARLADASAQAENLELKEQLAAKEAELQGLREQLAQGAGVPKVDAR